MISLITLESCQSSSKKKNTAVPDCDPQAAQYNPQSQYQDPYGTNQYQDPNSQNGQYQNGQYQNQYNQYNQQGYGLNPSMNQYNQNNTQYNDPSMNQYNNQYNNPSNNYNQNPYDTNNQQPGFNSSNVTVSYVSTIQPLMQKYCVQCHSPSGGQSDLSTSSAVRGNIQAVISRANLPATDRQVMPPQSTGLVMTQLEKQQLQQWQSAGFPENSNGGSANQLPNQTSPYTTPQSTNPCL